jgi:hypothetical protein
MENQYKEEKCLNEEMRKNQNDLKDQLKRKDEVSVSIRKCIFDVCYLLGNQRNARRIKRYTITS